MIRVCGSLHMASGVTEVLDNILKISSLSIEQLKVAGRYADDVF